MKIVRDNCKNCNSGCEHAGKDREFVCVKGVSCKIVKPKPEFFCAYGERKEVSE